MINIIPIELINMSHATSSQAGEGFPLQPSCSKAFVKWYNTNQIPTPYIEPKQTPA